VDGPEPRRVQLLVTCLVEALRPAVGWGVVRVLERLGVQVEVPQGQTCCGQPAYNAGQWSEARSMARHTLEVLGRSSDPVAVPSGSCADMLTHGYPELFRDDPEPRRASLALAERTLEFGQLVSGLGGSGRSAPRGERVTVHPPCHLLRGLGQADVAERLVDASGGDRVVLQGADECCGFGGLFAVKQAAISGAMLSRKLDAIEASGASRLVSCDLSCLAHIEGGLRRRGSQVRAQHLAEWLAE